MKTIPEKLKVLDLGILTESVYGNFILAPDYSWIKNRELELFLRKIGVIICFELTLTELEIIIEESLIHHTSTDYEEEIKLNNAIPFQERSKDPKIVGLSVYFGSDSIRSYEFFSDLNKIYSINEGCFGILESFDLFFSADVELLLPVDFNVIPEDSMHGKIKKMMEQMNIFFGFGFDFSKEVLTFKDDNIFNDLAYRSQNWNLAEESFGPIKFKKMFESKRQIEKTYPK